VIGLLLAARLLAVGVGPIARAIWPPLAAAAGMGAGLVVVREVVVADWLVLIAAGLVGGLLYVGLLSVFAREALADLRAKIAAGRVARSEPGTG
jgi:hypothetical protein